MRALCNDREVYRRFEKAGVLRRGYSLRLPADLIPPAFGIASSFISKR